MTDINKINSGIDTSFSTKLNSNLATSLRQSGLTQVEQLIDRAVTHSADGGQFAEAYIDADGRNNTVSANTGEFLTDKMIPALSTDLASGDTTSDPDSFTDASNAFDSDDATFAIKSVTGNTAFDTRSLGKTYSAITLSAIKIKTDVSYTGAITSAASIAILLQGYDGSTWSTIHTLATSATGFTGSASYDGLLTGVFDYEGIRVAFAGNPSWDGASTNVTAKIYTLEYYTATEPSEITHTIPSGTFSSTTSSAFLTFKAEDWESGADVQFKLTNATEDTGWLNSNEVVSFTALTAEPDDLIVKLIPKSSSPTANYPSINGVALYGDRP